AGYWQRKVQWHERNNDWELGSVEHHGHGANRRDDWERGGNGRWGSGQQRRNVHSDGRSEHHVTYAEHWSSGIVDRDYRNELWAVAGYWQRKVERHERKEHS